MNKPDDLILLGSMPIPDAHIVKGVLDEYGIPSEIVGETLSTVFAMPGTSLVMTRIFVFRRDIEKALEVLYNKKTTIQNNENIKIRTVLHAAGCNGCHSIRPKLLQQPLSGK